MTEPASDPTAASDPAPRRSARLPKALRLLAKRDFDAVFSRRTSAADRMMVVYARPNGLGAPRLGLAVSRKVGGAVRRNLWKRLLREAFRVAQHDLPAVDLVCLPRQTERPRLREVDASLRALAAAAAARRPRESPAESGPGRRRGAGRSGANRPDASPQSGPKPRPQPGAGPC